MNITLIGSTRFMDQFQEANRELTLRGHVVHGLSNNQGRVPEGAAKVLFDLVHLAKIEESSCCLLLGDGYVGVSTAREICWAYLRDRPVLPLWPWMDKPKSGLWDFVDRELRSPDWNNWTKTLRDRVQPILNNEEGKSICM